VSGLSRLHKIADTTPASASTAVGSHVGGLHEYDSLAIVASLVGATGGTLDIYLQISPDQGTTWVDYAHFAQLAGGAAAVTKVWTVSRGAQQTTATTVGTGTSVALAANTIIGGEWGDRMRAVYVAGAGTSVGAAIVISILGTRAAR